MLNKPLLYWRTVRYLKPVQVYARLWNRLHGPTLATVTAAAFRTPTRLWKPISRAPRQLGPLRFRFLGVEQHLSAAADWNHPDWPKLWLYNLHYFEDLVATDASLRVDWHRDLIGRWITDNSVGEGIGWEPYPTSLRLVNWGKWLLAGNAAPEGMLQSMVLQATHLAGRLEHHLLGNHLWANFKALLFCGCVFEGEEADRWRASSLQAFRKELDEQILADGGHYERSPMYHSLLLEDLLDLLQLSSVYPDLIPSEYEAYWREKSRVMVEWLQAMCHPDGDIAFFNDTAFGIAARPANLLAYASRVGVPVLPNLVANSRHLMNSGYLRLAGGSAVVIADAAPVGPDHLPGHAHADTLSFELSLHGRRLFVNGGTSTYEIGMQRSLERSTALHNTVEVDGHNSSEVWHAFRVARRAYVHDVAFSEGKDAVHGEAWHDGYLRLPGKVRHERQWSLHKDHLVVHDLLTGVWSDATARFRVAPGIDVVEDGPAAARLSWELHEVRCVFDGGVLSVTDGSWHPEFGAAVPCRVLEVRLATGQLTSIFRWGAGTA